jgi:hypothetical protein
VPLPLGAVLQSALQATVKTQPNQQLRQPQDPHEATRQAAQPVSNAAAVHRSADEAALPVAAELAAHKRAHAEAPCSADSISREKRARLPLIDGRCPASF